MLIHAGFFAQPQVFSPASDPLNIAWVDASDPASFTVAGSDVTAISNKGLVGAVSVTVFDAPQSGTRTQNSLNIFDCDGVDDGFNINNVLNAGSLLFSMAAIVDTSTNAGETLLGTHQLDRVRATTGDAAGAFNYNIITPAGVSDITPVGGYESVFRIFTLSLNFTTGIIEAFVDGTSVGSVNDYTTSINNSTNALAMTNHNLNQFVDGAVGEYTITTDVSAAQRQSSEGYLAHKWGVQAQLPAGHPYKASPP